jgi:hypothetical protein
MRSSLRVAAACAALLATLVLVPTAGAAVKASAALQRSGDAFRLEVKVTSTKAFTASSRPRSVKVGSLSLRRVSAARKSATFRSGSITADAATRLNGSRVAIRVTSRAGTRTLRANVAGAPPETPTGATPTTPTTPGTPPPSQPSAVRNDAAGQGVMTGDLLLEWASFGNVTAEYRRLWFMADGTFRMNVIDWMQQTGETCRRSFVGTWTFKEGWTADVAGGLVLVKVGINAPGLSGDEVLTFANAEPNNVYVGGSSPAKYERNPQIMQGC